MINEAQQPALVAPPSAKALIDDFRRQQEALRVQARELAQLRAEMQNAAARDASSIITAARARVRRITLNARRELLGLAAELQIATNIETESDARETVAPERPHIGRLLDARHEVRQILSETKADLEKLAEDAVMVSLAAQPKANDPRPRIDRLPDLTAGGEPGMEISGPLPGLEVAPRSAKVLIDDVRRRQEALRVQARELAQLRAEMQDAAAREASSILSTARAEVRRIILNVRRELLGLAAEVQIVTNIETESDALATFAPERLEIGPLLDARHEVRQILSETKADLEKLVEDAVIVSPAAQPKANDPRPRIDRLPDLTAGGEPGVEISRPLFGSENTSRRSIKVVNASAAALTLSGLFILFGTVWWIRSEQEVLSRVDAQPSAPPSALEQTVAAAPADPPEGTTSGSLSLRVQAQRPTWIRATVDGRSDAGGILQAGEIKQMRAEQEVSLRVGNAGAVRVSLNGAEPTVVGREGEVVTRRFTASASPPQPGSDSLPRTDGTGSTDHNNTRENAGVGSRLEQNSAALFATVPTVGTAASAVRNGAEPAPARSTTSTSAATADAASAELTNATSRWLDAYYRQDPLGIASLASREMTLSDRRDAAERLPGGLGNVHRTLERVTFQFAGETAILTARMTEEAEVAGQARRSVAWVSHVWLHESGKWRLLDVRLLADAKLK